MMCWLVDSARSVSEHSWHTFLVSIFFDEGVMRLLQRLKLAPALFCGMAASENRDGQVRVGSNRSRKPIAHTRWRRFPISLIVARFSAILAVVQPGRTDDCGV